MEKGKETPRSFKVFTTAPTFHQFISRVIILPLVSGALRQLLLFPVFVKKPLEVSPFLAFTSSGSLYHLDQYIGSPQTVSVNLSGELVYCKPTWAVPSKSKQTKVAQWKNLSRKTVFITVSFLRITMMMISKIIQQLQQK